MVLQPRGDCSRETNGTQYSSEYHKQRRREGIVHGGLMNNEIERRMRRNTPTFDDLSPGSFFEELALGDNGL